MTLTAFLEQLEYDGSKVLETVCAESRNPCVGWLLSRNKTYGVETAEDIFTDAVLILWQNAQQGSIKPSDTQVQTYLMTTCRYIQNNQLRKPPMEADFDNLLTELADQNPEERLDKEAYLNRLEWALEQLKGNCSIIIKGFYLEEKSLEDIAKICKLTYESVKSLRFRCFNTLKNLFFGKK